MSKKKKDQSELNRKNRKERWVFGLAFLMPVISMFIGYVINDVYPFGDQSILCSDLYNQYLPFFADLRDTLRNGGSLLFSWNLGLGSNFLALYAYYLASPFNWLLVFCPFKYLIEFMTVLIMVKMGLCGLSFAYYLSEHFQKKDFSVSIFSTVYAMCGFVCAYNWDIMWLDVIALTPLVILGLEKLVREKKWKLYCVSLALSILFNYYIAMILCIFLVLYFLIQLIILPEELFRPGHILGAAFQFAFFSLLAAGIAAVLLFPVASALSSTKYASSAFPEKWEFYFTPFEAFSRHFINVDTEIGQDHWPNLYCSVGIFFMLPMYFLAKKIGIREKITNMVLLVFFLFSFSVNGLAFIWHGLNYPNCLPARQTFLYDFVLIVMFYQVYTLYREEKWWKYAVSGFVAAGMITGCILIATKSEFPDYSFVLTCVFAGVEFLLFWLFQKSRFQKLFGVLAFLVLFAELTENMTVAGILTSNRNNYVKDRDSYVELVKEANQIEKDDFFRIEMRERRTKNDAMYIGFHSSTMFSSTTGEQLQKFYYELGIASSKVFYWNPTGTPLLNSMLGIRYLFSEKDNLTNPFYKLVDTKGNVSLYQYTHTLPLGYMIDAELEDKWNYKEGTPVKSQNELAKALGANGVLMESVNGMDNHEGESSILLFEEGYYYVYVAYKYVDDIKMTITYSDGSSINKTFKQVQNDYLLDCGYCPIGTEIVFIPKEKGEENCNMDLRPYRFNEACFEQAHRILSEQTMKVTSYSDTKLTGEIEVKEAGKLVTSIPYEAGWTLYVDGKETEIEFFADTMIAVSLPEGKHEIILKFYPVGLKEGILTSLICLSCFGLLLLLQRYRRKQDEGKEQIYISTE